jgi:ABC-type amino acid transport substrate-binding protein
MALTATSRFLLLAALAGAAYVGYDKWAETHPQAAKQVVAAVTTQVSSAELPNRQKQQVVQTTVHEEDSLSKIIEEGVVHTVVQSPSKPFFYMSRGTPAGFNVDFMNLLFSQAPFTKKHTVIKIDTHPVNTYPEVPQGLLDKKIGAQVAIDGLTFVDTDLEGVVYSKPYVSDFGYALIVPNGSPIQSAQDTDGKTIGVLEGDPDVMDYVKQHMKGATVVALSDKTTTGERTWISDALKAKKADAIVYDYPFAVAEIAGTRLTFASTKLQGSDIAYKIGVRKGDQALLQAINTAIDSVITSPKYEELMRKHFASDNKVVVNDAVSGESVYVVKRGDTLGSIAKTLLGDQKKYTLIQTRNNIANPHLISTGQKLVIPK